MTAASCNRGFQVSSIASVLLICSASQSWALTPEELTKALYVKLANSVLPNGNQLKIGKTYFVIANPGVIVGNPANLVGEGYRDELISSIDKTLRRDPFVDEGTFHLTQLYK